MFRFNASEIAALIGKNPYKKQAEAIQDCWNRHARKRGIDAPKIPVAMLEAMKVLSRNKEVVGTLKEDIKVTSASTKTSKETESENTKLVTKIAGMELKPEEKKILQDYAQSKLFTNYGTRSEENVHDIYKELTGQTILTENRMLKKDMPQGFQVGGKIDGQLDDGTVIEIKNRTRRLFHELKEYENVQVQVYLQVLDQLKAHLVECYDDGTKKHLNIIEVERNQTMWDDEILPGLTYVRDEMDKMFK